MPFFVFKRTATTVIDTRIHALSLLEALPVYRCLSVVNVVCCQVEVSARGLSLVEGSPTECGASRFDPEISTLSKPWPVRTAKSLKKITQRNS
jgi:hypothetical protein